jgi:hypothetical protein
MREAVHWMMRALMRTWHHDVIDSLSTMPRAHGVPQAHSTGLDPDRILVFGNGLASGWGVASHELAIPGELARSLTSLTGRGADVDVSEHSDLKLEGATRALEGRELSGYDAVVVIIGAGDALSLTPRAKWRASMHALIEMLADRTSASARIVVVAQSPIRAVPPFDNLFGRLANSHATALNAITHELCEAQPRVEYLTLPPPVDPVTERLGTPERYRAWGRFIALQLVPQLNDGAWPAAQKAGSSARDDRNRPQKDEDRYSSLDQLGIIESGPDERIDHIVATARAIFGTRGAAFTLVDRDRQWHKSISGFDISELPLELSVCAVTIREKSSLIVADARDDPRFSPDSPMAFYAGYPIEAPDGQRIGALCVFDTRPRNPSIVDPRILRDLALLVQEQVWRYPLPSDDAPKTQETPPAS